MNLLFVIDNLGPGGAQRQMVNLAKGLALRGHGVEFFTYYSDSHYKKILDDLSIPINLHLKKFRYDLSPIIKIRELVVKNKYDVTLSFLDTPNFYSEVAHTFIGKTKLVVSDRLAFPSRKIPLKFKMLLVGHGLADRVIVNSHHHRTQIVEELPCLRNKVQTIYNGCDLDIFRPLKHRKFKEDGRLSLIVVSSVSFKKNSINLAKALHICKNKYGLDVYITWVGSTYVSGQRTAPFEETNAYLKKFGLDGYWEWSGVRQDIPKLLAEHDALIHPSYYEGLPNAVCEALACGKPVLVSNVCDHPLLVKDGVRGYLFDPYNPDDIACSILKLYNNPDEYEKICINSRLFAEKHLSMDRYVSSYEDLFFSIKN